MPTTDTCNVCGMPAAEHLDGLKCCPFCETTEDGPIPDSTSAVWCRNCGASAPTVLVWNRRAAPASDLQAEVERLRAALRKIADPTVRLVELDDGRCVERVYEDLALAALKQEGATHGND